MNDVVFQLQEGIIIMLIGMGVVFAFLTIMVGAMTIMGRVIQKLNMLYPEPVEESKPPVRSASADDDERIAVAIAAVMARS